MAGYTNSSHSDEDTWQTEMRNIRERNRHMFNNELMSDVFFTVGKSEKMRIPAHKYVMGISSPVFYAMFYGRMAEKGCEIKIADCEPNSFMELLRYIYYDEAKIDPSNVFGILYLAKKYIVPFLAENCVQFLEENIDHQNAFTLLAQARYFCEPKLEEKCWEIIDRETSKVLSSDSFTEIDHETLLAVLTRDTLTVLEAELFKAVKHWAEAECNRKILPPTPENKRSVLSSALYFVRFPVMTLKEFSDDAAQSGILTSDETINIFLYFGSKDDSKVKSFLTHPRPGAHRVYRCTRFPSYGQNWLCEGTNVDSIKFTVDRDITVLGVGLYGISNVEDSSRSFSVDVELLDSHNDVMCTYEGSFFSDVNKHVHDILFDEPVIVRGHRPYIIRVLLKGPSTLGGTDGMRDVIAEGVRFRFDVDEASFNGTTTADGQIPDIVFKI
ncbi:BTB/POZ domain-containing protein 6-like [Montipora capricornis]